MSENPIADIYLDGTYAENNPSFGDDNAQWKILNALKAIKDFDIEVSDLAEVGCGAGAILIGLAEALDVKSATGYEPMPEAYAIAKKRESKQVKFNNESINGETTARHDLVLCFDVFEHIENYFSFLRDLSRVSDQFLFHIPLDMNAQMVARGKPIQYVRDSVGHIHYFSRDSAIESLKQCGYEIKGEFYTSAADSAYNGGILYHITNLLWWMFKKLSPHFSVRLLGGHSLMVYATVKK